MLFIKTFGVFLLVLVFFIIYFTNKEQFINYSWGKYYLDDNILHKDDENRKNYSIAQGIHNINSIQMADLENTTTYLTSKKMFNKNMIFTKDSCGYGNWILPKIVDKDNPVYKNTFLCNNGCSRCDITTYGTYTDTTPRPLYTTSSIY